MSANPLIQDLIENEAFPSVSVALPSGGRWYEEGVLAAGVDPLDLPVGVLGILAEQNYRDPWLMLSGEAIPRMMKGVCPSILQAQNLCELDLETILLASRLVSYGPKIELTHNCSNIIPKTEEEIAAEKAEAKDKNAEIAPNRPCGHENGIEVDINEHILRYDVIGDDVVEERFKYTLNRVDQTVHLRPPAYARVIGQMRESVARQKQIDTLEDLSIDDMIVSEEAMRNYSRIIDMTSETALENMEASIHAISTTDGKLVNGSEFIREWLLSLPSDEAEGIMEKINELTRWLQSFSDIRYNCAGCGAEQVFRLELDANRLFGQAGASTPPKKRSPKSKRGGRRRKIQ